MSTTDEQDQLLASCKELRDALAAAFRVIARYGAAEALEREMAAAGVKHGVGVRADAVLALRQARRDAGAEQP